jgi:hypothetical protein
MAKKIYSFQLTEDITPAELKKRAADMGTPVARLFDFSTHLITKCSIFFLKHLGELSGQYKMEPWIILEKILIDRKAQRDVFKKYWGTDPRGQLAMMSDENGPIIGEELYQALYNYYDKQEQPKWLLTQPGIAKTNEPTAEDIAWQKRLDSEPKLKAEVDYSSEITKRANIVLKKHGEAKALEYMKAMKALERAMKRDEALAAWPWPE